MAESNPNTRLETFCDGVFAIALTLLILDIKIPSLERIDSTNDFWLALRHLLPSILAFLLSFIIILITWVNHHGTLNIVNKTSAAFFFANGFLLLTIVFIPFPTALMGEYLFTDHSSPAVILYVATMAVQAIAWIVLTSSVLKNNLAKDEEAILKIRENKKYGYFAFVVYSLCAVVAIWFPLAIAIITTIIWIFRLIISISFKHE